MEWKVIISTISNVYGDVVSVMVSTGITAFFSLVATLVAYFSANRQIKEAKKTREENKQQFEKSLQLQKEQYEKEKEHNHNIEIIHEKPYLVFAGTSDFNEDNPLYDTLTITFKNKGQGSAFNIIQDTKAENEGNSGAKIEITRSAPIQDPIAMVGENIKTYWTMNKLGNSAAVGLPITIRYDDASDRKYQQKFIFTIGSKGNAIVTNYASPELIEG